MQAVEIAKSRKSRALELLPQFYVDGRMLSEINVD
jgi:hypothetical protein